MKLSCSAYQAGSSYAQKILSGHNTQNYGATSSTATTTTDSSHGITMPTWTVEEVEGKVSPNETEFGAESSTTCGYQQDGNVSGGGGVESGGASRGESSRRTSSSLSHHSDVQPDQKGNQSDSTSISKAPATSSCSPSDSPAHRSKSNQRWMKLRTTVQLSGAIQTIQQKKAPLKREDSFLKRFSTRQIPEAQETFEIGDDGEPGGGEGGWSKKGRKKRRSLPRTVVNPDCNFYFYWLMLLTFCVLYNLWTLIVRQSFPELQENARLFWILADVFSDVVFLLDIAVQFRTGYLEQGLMVYQTRKLANHYVGSKHFYLDIFSLVPTDLVQFYLGANPMVRCPRFLKIYRVYNYYYMVESRTVYPNVLRVVNLIHILLLLAHWFGCFYYLISQAEGFDGDWGYPDPSKNKAFAPLTRKYLGSLYWSTLTLTTIGDLPQPHSNWQYLFTIVSYLIGVFIFATIVGQVGNVITNRNANRLEFERLLDGAKMYMRHHKVPRDMQRRVLRWYDYSWSRGRIQGGGDINTALGLLPDKLKTELALHVNLSVLKKVTIFQECQPEFLHDLVLKMKAYIFTPGDLICRKGEVAREMFIIADGILEVISETGKVLTTMQAGDFFGEIGILNLDGLNKRTADVRSVGYSELFSLSREDVLAAMKDYPEAQEILQTLGRKRLMEARKASGPAVKKPGPGGGPPGAPGGGAAGVVVGVVPNLEPKKSSPVHATALSHSGSINSHKELMDGCGGGGGSGGPVDTTTGKRIVEKLRSDVKGLRNAIRRSRKSNSSKEDSSEPESSGKVDGGEGLVRGDSNKGSSTSSIPRGVLKRMHNVATSGDDKEKAGASSVGDPSNIKSSLSPSSAAPSVASAFKKSSLASAVKRVQLGRSPSIAKKKAEDPPEIIGAGLPLIQRLRLLKQKEEREQKQQAEREAMMKTLIPSNLSLASPSGSPTVSPIMHTKVCVEAPPKPKTMDPATALAQVVERTRVERASISSNDSASTISSPPSTSLQLLGTFSPKSSLLIGEAAAAAASKVTAEPIPMAAASGGFFPPLWTPSPPRDPRSSVSEPIASSSTSCPPNYPCHHYHSASVSSSDRPSALQLRQQHAAKNYGSVDDLSPEFSRLPFIKKLKILNERQKIAEILLSKSANSVLTRSTSEGSNENPVVGGEVEVTLHSVQLGRRTQSNKEKLEIEGGAGDEEDGGISPYFTSKGSFQKSPPSEEEDGGAVGRAATTTTKTSSEDSNATVCLRDGGGGGGEDVVRGGSSVSGGSGHKSKVRKRRKVKKPCEEGRSEDSSPSPPCSPDGESNETPERRNLKSILKKLAETKEVGGDEGGGREEVNLLKAPTVEGYAARHRKFAKNVTFRRQAVTVVSPEGPTSPPYASAPTCLPSSSSTFSTSPISAPSARREPPPPGDEGSLLARRDQQQPTTDLSVILPLLQSLSSENMRLLSSLLVEGGGGGFVEPLPHEGLRLAQDEGPSGVKTIIYEKLDEIQRKFQARFDLLEEELRRRDEFISVLERRYCEESEAGGARRKGGGGRNHVAEDTLGIEGDVEMEEEDDDEEVEEYRRVGRITNQSSYLFSRGDSIDTVISAQDFDDEVFERAEVEYAEGQEALSEAGSVPPGGFLEEDEEEGGAGGRGQRSSHHAASPSSSSWGRESIEMRDLGPAPWQLEFHRDRDSLPPPNGGRIGDAVAVEIGNTSTETDDGSSEEGDGREEVVLEERRVSLEEDEEEESGNNESEGGGGGGSDEEEEEEGAGDINHKNWEVQMLVKEMEKQEEKRKTTEEVVGEVRKLENDIETLKVAFHEGNLSPSELDVLDSVLETKTRRIKVLFKALSVDSSVPGGQKKSGGGEDEGQEEWRKRRSYEDFFLRRGSGGSLTQQSVLMGGVGGSSGMSRAPGFPPRSLFTPFSSERSGGKLSPGETLDLQRLLLPRKHGGLGGMRRQASLCETSLGGRKRGGGGGDSSKRRESAGTVASFGKEAAAGVPASKKSSFFSRFGLVRQLTGRRKGPSDLAEESKRDQVEEEEISEGTREASVSSVGLTHLGSSPKLSSSGEELSSTRGETVTTDTTTILVLNTSSTTTTTVGGSGGGCGGGGSGVFPTPSSRHDPPNSDPVSIPGESQPLLKK